MILDDDRQRMLCQQPHQTVRRPRLRSGDRTKPELENPSDQFRKRIPEASRKKDKVKKIMLFITIFLNKK